MGQVECGLEVAYLALGHCVSLARLGLLEPGGVLSQDCDRGSEGMGFEHAHEECDLWISPNLVRIRPSSQQY